jgi:hypothetical protein
VGVVNIGFSPALMKAAIRQEGARAIKHGIEVMRKEGEAIAELAVENAPYDEGKLEDAIKVREVGGGRGEGGKFLRREIEVYVDPDMPGSGGMRVGDYAYLMHEGLGPYGDGTYGLGPGSAAKAATGKEVGGKFLERAVDKIAPRIRQKLEAMYKRLFK